MQDSDIYDCLNNCFNCYKACIATKNYCIDKGGKYSEYAHIKSLENCAYLCLSSLIFLSESSEFANEICGLSEEGCNLCAASCAKYADDPVMRNCKEVCQECEVSCQRMAAE